ncbi:hypothetical protein AKO1_003316 [Acrasis kona]|uniref:BTB domain-containing protein n=1 Tax=Acrasis kona TaxID=1008807 RepID=A0AAW2Z9C9_9EUKA
MIPSIRSYKPPSNYSDIKDIWLACKLGIIKDVQSMLAKDPSLVNKANEHDRTPLYIAAYAGHYELVKYLLEHGAQDDEYKRSYLSSLNIPIRHLISSYTPRGNTSSDNPSEPAKQPQDIYKKLLHNYGLVRPNQDKVDTGMSMGGTIIFKLINSDQQESYRFPLALLLSRWKNFAKHHLGDNKREVIDKVKNIKLSNTTHSDDGQDVIILNNVEPKIFAFLQRYIYTSVDLDFFLTLTPTWFPALTESGYNNCRDLYKLCSSLHFEELSTCLVHIFKWFNCDFNDTYDSLFQKTKKRNKSLRDYIEIEYQRLLYSIKRKPSKHETNLEIEIQRAKSTPTSRNSDKSIEYREHRIKQLEIVLEHEKTCQLKKFHGDVVQKIYYTLRMFFAENDRYTFSVPISKYKIKNKKGSDIYGRFKQFEMTCCASPPILQKLIDDMIEQEKVKYTNDLKLMYRIINKDYDVFDDEKSDPETLRDIAMFQTFNVRLLPIPYGEDFDVIDVNQELCSNTIACNSDFLSWCNDFFKVAMTGPFSEADELRKTQSTEACLPVFNVPLCSEQALSALVEYTYSNDCTIDEYNAYELIFLSMRCQLPKLSKLCEAYITFYIDSYRDNVYDVLMLSDLISNREMKEAATDKLIEVYLRKYKTREMLLNDINEELLNSDLPMNVINLVFRRIKQVSYSTSPVTI